MTISSVDTGLNHSGKGKRLITESDHVNISNLHILHDMDIQQTTTISVHDSTVFFS